jgi:hypothetical protein
MNKTLLIALALSLLNCVAFAASNPPALAPVSPSSGDSTATKPDDIQPVQLFIQDSAAHPDAFGLTMSGPLAQPKVEAKATAPAAPVITPDMVVNAMRVEMINPPDSILVNGRFIETGTRLQVVYKGIRNVITLASVSPTLITFTWDDGSQGSIHVQSPNYAQVLTDSANDSDTMSSTPPINLDAKPAVKPSDKTHNQPQFNRH